MDNTYDHIELGQHADQTKTTPVQTNSPAQPHATTTTVKIILGLLIILVFVALAVAVAAMVLLSGEIRELEMKMQEQRDTMPNGETPMESASVPPTKPADKPPVLPSGGAVYVRWGRTVCSSNNSKLVYAGVAGGTFYNKAGGGANYQCLTQEPEWGNYNSVLNNGGKMYGAEYELGLFDPFQQHESVFQDNVPCAVCRSGSYTSQVMIPGRKTCFSGWMKAYGGYLMSERVAVDRHRTEYVCVDSNPETVLGGGADQNGALFYSVEAVCGSLPCPPYENGRELTCVVCLK